MLGFAGIVQSGNRGTPLLLDTYSGAAAAYSLRKLRLSYTGSAVRVRRSSDSVEQDIGFDANGNLDETTLKTFCGENLFQYSEQFDNAVWAAIGDIIVTANQANAPTGTNTSDFIKENSASANHYIRYNISGLTSGSVYNISCYVKQAVGNRFFGFLTTLNSNVSWAVFDINNGLLGSVKDSTSAISAVGNGWYRCSISVTSNSTSGVIDFRLLSTSTNGNLSYTGDNTSGIYLWGAQLNTGSLKPYVQTTSATRDGNGFVTKWYDQSGNARDAAQTTAANQPRIVNAGVVEKVSSKPSVNFNSGGTAIKIFTTSITNSILPTTGSSSVDWFVISKATSLGNGNEGTLVYLGNANVYSPNWHNNVIQNNTSGNVFLNNYDGTEHRAAGGTITNYNLINGYRDGVNNVLRLNGSQVSSVATGNPNINTSANLAIGGINTSAGQYFDGYMSEILLYPNAQPSRTAIESNINTYYSIY